MPVEPETNVIEAERTPEIEAFFVIEKAKEQRRATAIAEINATLARCECILIGVPVIVDGRIVADVRIQTAP